MYPHALPVITYPPQAWVSAVAQQVAFMAAQVAVEQHPMSTLQDRLLFVAAASIPVFVQAEHA